MNWNKLISEKQLADINNQSADKPVLILKHSTTCSISAAALSRLERNWNDSDSERVILYYLDLLNYRSISNKIADDYGVKHESPQVLIIRQGKCVYHKSHFDIEYKELIKTL